MKKKIGIMTYHRSLNYGALMQAFSLATSLQERTEFEVEVVDFVYKTVFKRDTIKLVARRPWRIIDQMNVLYKFNKFITTKLPISSHRLISDNKEEIMNYVSSLNYNLIIIGSDEVWKLNNDRPFPSIYWLDGIKNVVKFSYAASSNGTDFDKVSYQEKEKLREIIDDFSVISIRDIMTDNFIRSIKNDIKTVISCDPAFLLDISKLKQENFVQKHSTKIKKLANGKPILGLMVRDRNLGIKIYKKFKDRYFILGILGSRIYCDKLLTALSPEEWVSAFELCDLLIVNYFHGAVFSMLNKKPFIAIDSKDRYSKNMSKIEYMMCQAQISDFYFNTKRKGFNWKNIESVMSNIEKEFKMGNAQNYIKEQSHKFDEYIVKVTDCI